MKLYKIAMFVFSFNASLALLNSLNLFDVQMAGQLANISAQNITEQVLQSAGPTLLGFNPFAVFGIFVNVIYNSTVGLPGLLMNLGVPTEVATIVGAFVNLLYAVAVIEFIAGRSFKMMD